MTRRRILLAASLGVVFASLASAQKSLPKPAAMEKVERGWPASPTISVLLKGSVGRVKIIGWNRDSLSVTGAVPKGARLEGMVGSDGRSLPTGAKLFVEAPDELAMATAVLEIRLPAGGRAWLKSGSANVEVSDFTGGLDVNVIGGSVRVSGSPREAQVEAMDAEIVIDGSPPWLRAKTATGDITVRGSSTDAVLNSVSGAIRTEGGSVERLHAETVSGSITFASDIAPSGEVAVVSHNGGIELRLPLKGHFDATATSITGSIENRFDRSATKPGREGRGASVTVGRGIPRARVTARAFKGTIVLIPR